MEEIQFIFWIIGGIISVCATIFAFGRFTGKWQSKANVLEEVQKDVEEIIQKLDNAVKPDDFKSVKEILESVLSKIHELEKSQVLSKSKAETIEGQVRQLFKAVEKLGEKLENFMDKILEVRR